MEKQYAESCSVCSHYEEQLALKSKQEEGELSKASAAEDLSEDDMK